MAVTAEQIKALILLEVGDTDSGVLAANWEAIWESYADKALVAPRLQELYVKRRCIEIVLGQTRKEVDFATDSGLTFKAGQEADRLLKMLTEAKAEIATVERQVAIGIPAAGVITKSEIIEPPTMPPAPGPLNANDPRYSGSPYYGRLHS